MLDFTAIDLIFAHDGKVLGIYNQKLVDRSLATQETIGTTSYSVFLKHVQHGTWQKDLRV